MNERIDFSAIDLSDVERARLVSRIMARAEAELQRRGAVDVSPMIVLSDWLRPALAAAALLAVVSGSVLARRATVDDGPGQGLADALAVPSPADAWLVAGRTPTVADLIIAMEEER